MIDPQLLLHAASRAHGSTGRKADALWASAAVHLGRRGWISACAHSQTLAN